MNEKEIKKTILGLYIFRICMGGFACCIPIIVLFWKTFDITLTQITLLQSFFALLLLLLEVPSGYFADIWGRKTALIFASVFFTIGSGIYMFADCYFHFAIAEVFCAFAIALISGADAALLYDSLKNHNRQDQYEKIWGTIMSCSLISYGFFNAIGGVLYTVNERLPFILGTCIIMLTIPATFLIKEPYRDKIQYNKQFLKTLIKTIVPVFKQNAYYRQLLITNAFIFTGVQVALWFYQPYFQSCGVSPFWFGFIFTSFNIVAALGSKYSEYFDKLSKNLPYGFIPLISIAASYILMGTCIWTFGFIIIFIQQFVRGWFSVSISKQINNIVESKERATLLSFCTMSGCCLYTMILPIMGLIADSLALNTALLIGGMSCLSISLACLIKYPILKEGVQQ